MMGIKSLLMRILCILFLGGTAAFLVSCGGETVVDNGLHFALSLEIKGFDPSQANDLYSHTALVQIYEPLYQYSYLERPFKLEPLLAESMPEISRDRMEYTIPIKKGVVFQDDPCFKEAGGKGREITARDFIYSFKRIADKRVNSNGWWIFQNRIKGLDEFREKSENAVGNEIYAETVEGLVAEDDYTLLIKLKEPYPQLIYILAMAYTCVVPREAVECYGEEFLNHPVGTGPFMLKNWVRRSKIEYVRSASFRGETYPVAGEPGDDSRGLLADAGKSVPFMDNLTFHIRRETSAMWLEFKMGNFDRAGIPKDNYDSVIDEEKNLREDFARRGINLWKTPLLDITYIAMNMEDPVLGKSLALRQALSLSVNVEELIHSIYNHRAIAAKNPIPPGLEGYDPDFENPMCRYDIKAAKEKIVLAKKELGMAEDEVFEFSYDSQNSNTTARQMDQFVIGYFQDIGVKINYNVNTWPQFLERIKYGKGQIWGAAWGADYPDAENFLQLLYGPNKSPGDNGANYQNPEYDALYEKTRTMQDCPERTEIYEKMARIAAHDCPWIFNTHRESYALYYDWMKNYKPHDVGSNFYKYYRVDPEQRERMKTALRDMR